MLVSAHRGSPRVSRSLDALDGRRAALGRARGGRRRSVRADDPRRQPHDRDPGRRRVVRRRGHGTRARHLPGDRVDQHDFPGDVHLRARHRGAAAAEPAAARSRQAAIRRGHVPRRELRDAASAVLPQHRAHAGKGARPSRLRRHCRRAAGGARARDESRLLVRGRPEVHSEHRGARVRSGAGSGARRSGVRLRVLAQSAHAPLLARPRRGLPAFVRRRRADVGQRAPGAARQRARRQPRRRGRGRACRLLLSVLPGRSPSREESTWTGRRPATRS